VLPTISGTLPYAAYANPLTNTLYIPYVVYNSTTANVLVKQIVVINVSNLPTPSGTTTITNYTTITPYVGSKLSQVPFRKLTFYNGTPFTSLTAFTADASFNSGLYGLYINAFDSSGNIYELQSTPYIPDFIYNGNSAYYNTLYDPYFSNQYIFNSGNNGTTGSKIFVYTQSGTIVSTDFYNAVNGTTYNYVYQGPMLLDSYYNVYYQSQNGTI